MDKQKERKRMLKGIEEEIERLGKQENKTSDYQNKIEELKKEAETLREELNKH